MQDAVVVVVDGEERVAVGEEVDSVRDRLGRRKVTRPVESVCYAVTSVTGKCPRTIIPTHVVISFIQNLLDLLQACDQSK